MTNVVEPFDEIIFVDYLKNVQQCFSSAGPCYNKHASVPPKIDDQLSAVICSCCCYWPNVDFLKYTRDQFGEIRYMHFDAGKDAPPVLTANIVVVTNQQLTMYTIETLLTQNVTALFLMSCNIDDEQIKQFARLWLPHLRSLNLSYNQISCQGTRDLVDALVQHTDLQSLALTNNIIGYDGALALVDLVKSNTSLSLLAICDNPFHYGKTMSVTATIIERMMFYIITYREISDMFEKALECNIRIDSLHAVKPLLNYDFPDRPLKRQRVMTLMACAARQGLVLCDEIWRHAMQKCMLME